MNSAPAQEIRPVEPIRVLFAGPKPSQRAGQTTDIRGAECVRINKNDAGMSFLILRKIRKLMPASFLLIRTHSAPLISVVWPARWLGFGPAKRTRIGSTGRIS